MSRAAEFFGTNDVNRLFPDGALKTTVPWDQASANKTHRPHNLQVIHEAMRTPERYQTESIDPRTLRATQPSLIRAAFTYYHGSPEYSLSGRTFADQHQSANQTPIMFRNENNGQHVLMTGHHRAATALLRGEQFNPLVVSGMPHTHAEARDYQQEQEATRRKASVAAREAEMWSRIRADGA